MKDASFHVHPRDNTHTSIYTQLSTYKILLKPKRNPGWETRAKLETESLFLWSVTAQEHEEFSVSI